MCWRCSSTGNSGSSSDRWAAFRRLASSSAFRIALGYLGGEWLDGKLGTEPWLKWIGLALGLAAGGVSLYRVVRRAQRVMEEEDESP